MKRILVLLAVVVCYSCQKENIQEPMSNYITANLTLNTDSLLLSTIGTIAFNNNSNKDFNYPAHVSVQLFDTINKVDYYSYINLDSDNYSSIENEQQECNISINKLSSYSKSIDFSLLYWNEGISFIELPASTYNLHVNLYILEPSNPGNWIRTDIILISKK